MADVKDELMLIGKFLFQLLTFFVDAFDAGMCFVPFLPPGFGQLMALHKLDNECLQVLMTIQNDRGYIAFFRFVPFLILCFIIRFGH